MSHRDAEELAAEIAYMQDDPDNLEKNYYPVDTEDNCAVVGQRIIEQIAKYKDNIGESQGWYTLDDKLVVGHYCTVK
jgi:hypothetical protein